MVDGMVAHQVVPVPESIVERGFGELRPEYGVGVGFGLPDGFAGTPGQGFGGPYVEHEVGTGRGVFGGMRERLGPEHEVGTGRPFVWGDGAMAAPPVNFADDADYMDDLGLELMGDGDKQRIARLAPAKLKVCDLHKDESGTYVGTMDLDLGDGLVYRGCVVRFDAGLVADIEHCDDGLDVVTLEQTADVALEFPSEDFVRFPKAGVVAGWDVTEPPLPSKGRGMVDIPCLNIMRDPLSPLSRIRADVALNSSDAFGNVSSGTLYVNREDYGSLLEDSEVSRMRINADAFVELVSDDGKSQVVSAQDFAGVAKAPSPIHNEHKDFAPEISYKPVVNRGMSFVDNDLDSQIHNDGKAFVDFGE